MRDVLDGVERRQAQGQQVAFVPVVGAAWSEPREAGAMMPVSEDGDGVGSVFGEPDLDQADVPVSSLRDGSGRLHQVIE